MMKAGNIIMRRQGLQETQDKSGSITATPGWKTRQPRGDWTKLPQGTQNTETLDNHNNPMATRRQSTRFSSTERPRKASNVRGIPSRPDGQLRWVLIVRTQL